jgi:phage terminase large subunit
LAELDGFAKYDSDAKAFLFPNKSRLKLGYCDTDADVLQYQGQEYDKIAFEEAGQFTEYQIRRYYCLCGQPRGYPRQAFYTLNPGGVSHQYFKRLFVDRDFNESENPDDYFFIQALVDDNTVLMEKDPDYVKMLDSLPEDERRAFRFGDWDVFAGQYSKCSAESPCGGAI